MKKIFLTVLLAMLTVLSVFGLSSCDDECTHEWGEWSISSPSTCTAQGKKQRKCSKCEEVQTESIDIADHEYDKENFVWTWNGYESATATLSCITDSTHARQINANVTDEVTTAPTCKATGTKTYTATVKIDGVTYTATKNETLAALGHIEVVDAAVAATCEKTGLTEGSHCSVCKEVFVAQQETSKAAHTETKIEAVAATCSVEGATEGVKCSVCGEILVAPQPTSKVAHTEETIPAVAATCSENGLTEGKKCSICDEVLVAQQPTNKLPHTETALLGVAPSCSEEGLTEGKKCSVCGTVTVEQEPIDKLPHTEETVVGTAPTCSATGLSDGKKCSVCKETLVAQTILPKVACDYESVITAPTCEDQGYTTHTCSMCKDSFVDTYVDELGHNWGAWEVNGSYTLRDCINECNCGKYQRITSINAIYNGIRLLTGESVWRNDVTVTATLSDNTTIDISDFTLENDVMTVDGSNYVTVKFHSLSTAISVPAIYDNLPGVTSSIEFSYDSADALKNDAVTITGFVGSSTDIVIPSYITIDTVRIPVRKIADYAFGNKENIRSVVIPDSVTHIGVGAFNNCRRMTTLTLGKGLTSIEVGTFYNCISLTEVNIPASVISIKGTTEYRNNNVNRKGAFENCTSLKKVTIGDASSDLATTVVGHWAFYNCTALEEVYIGNRVKAIESHAFSHCTKMHTLTIGTTVQSIGEYAFSECGALLTLAIPDSVTYIGTGAFNNCQRITTLTLGKGLTTIEVGTFYNCISLTEVHIPASVISIKGTTEYRNGDINRRGAFENCTSLKKVTIGDATSDLATTVVGHWAFYNCTSLEEVYIGNKVKTIESHAFSHCTAMHTLTIGTTIQTIGEYAFSECEALMTLVIPDSVTYIGVGAFNNCRRMTTLTLGKGLTSIEVGTFYNCISLTEVNIPVNVISIKGTTEYRNGDINRRGAFESCTSLKKVTIGDDTSDLATTVIGHYAFINCSALEEVYIGNKVKTIESHAFSHCTAMHTVTIGTTVQTIGEYAFSECEALLTLAIPDSVTYIGTGAFNNCRRMTTLTLGKGLTEIACGAFYNCISLTEVEIPANVITLRGSSEYHNGDINRQGVFENCTSLKKVTIGDATSNLATTVIGYYTFNNCTALEEVYIGNKVKTIQHNAFNGCTALKILTIGTSVQTIEDYAFSNCESIVNLVIPDSVTYIGTGAFNNCKRMTTLTLGKGLTEIGCGAFYKCISLAEVEIPANVITLRGSSEYHNSDINRRGVFENCTSLKKVTIGDTTTGLATTVIGHYAFYNCTALEEVYIGNQVKAIQNYSFAYCTSLETVDISDSVQEIGSNAFEGCVMLENFNIGTDVKNIGAYALANCTDLNSIIIPDNVMTLGNNVFNNCTALEDVTIVSGKDLLRSFGSNIFNGCSSLDRVYYTGTAEKWATITLGNNVYPLSVTPYYFSSSQPTTAGNYWYYNTNNAKRVWDVTEDAYRAEEYSENFAEIFGDESSSYATTFYNDLKNDTTLMLGIQAWELIHITADPTYIFDPGNSLISKKDLYKLTLYDILTGEDAETKAAFFEFFDQSSTEFMLYVGNMYMGDPTDAPIDIDMLYQVLHNKEASAIQTVLEKAMSPTDIECITAIIGFAENAYEALESVSQYVALRQIKSGYVDVLLYISNDTSNPQDLRNAALELVDWYQEACDLTLAEFQMKTFFKATNEDIYSWTLDKLVDVAIDSDTTGLLKAVNFTGKAIRAIAEPLKLDEFCEAYYRLKTSVGVESALRKLIQVTVPDYMRYENQGTSETYMCTVELYEKSVLCGFDYSIKLLTAYVNSSNPDEEGMADYNNLVATLNSFKAQKQSLYNTFDNAVLQKYVAYYS